MTRAELEALPVGTPVVHMGVCGRIGAHADRGIGIYWISGDFSRLLTLHDTVVSEISVMPRAEPEVAEKVDGLVVSTDTHCYHLIPQIAMQRLCERIDLGTQNKGKDSWNAMSENQSVLDSRKALARRLGHLINHSYRLLGKIETGEEWTEDDEREASAVMWGGMFAICAIAAQRKKQEK